MRSTEIISEIDIQSLANSTFSEVVEERVKIDLTSIQGYYKNKYKFRVESVNDFVSKVRKTDMCAKFFQQNDLKFAGLSQLFQDFYEYVKYELEKDPLLNKNINENMEEIAEYIMFNLHAEFFYGQQRSPQEIEFQRKCDIMEKMDEKAFEVEIDEKSKHTWKLAIKEASKIAEAQTPRAKLQQLGAAVVIIEHAYSLYKGESSNADVLVEFLPYVLVKAKIDRLLAHFNYIEAFHLTTIEGDPIEVYRTNLKISI